MTTLTLTRTHQRTTTIVQSRVKRDWMDATYNKHAYQCMPMTLANVYGWEVQIEEDLVVQWDGANPPQILQGEYTSTGRKQAVSSIAGMISINIGWAINTEENYSTWFTGPPNYFMDGAICLTATLPTSWWPDETQMNWKITKINEPVVFKAGDPICFFNIYDDRAMENVEIRTKNLWEDQELMQSRMNYSDLKMKNHREKPWEWTKGIKTGVDADGKRIGPAFAGLPKLKEPSEFTDVKVDYSTDWLLRGGVDADYSLEFSSPLGNETHLLRLGKEGTLELVYLHGGKEPTASATAKSFKISPTHSNYSQLLTATFDLDVPMTTTVYLKLYINSVSGSVDGLAKIGDFAEVKIVGLRVK
jgi:hypothetical protein